MGSMGATNFQKTKLDKVWHGDHQPEFLTWNSFQPFDVTKIKTSKLKGFKKKNYCAVIPMRHQIASFNYNSFHYDTNTGKMVRTPSTTIRFCPELLGHRDPTNLDAYVSGKGVLASTVKYQGEWWCMLGVLKTFLGRFATRNKWQVNGGLSRLSRVTVKAYDPIYVLHRYKVNSAEHHKIMEAALQKSLEQFQSALAGDPTITFKEQYVYQDTVMER